MKFFWQIMNNEPRSPQMIPRRAKRRISDSKDILWKLVYPKSKMYFEFEKKL